MSDAKILDIAQIEYQNTSNRTVPMEYFTIPYRKNKHILYFPLKGIVALVNHNFISEIKINGPIVKNLFDFVKKQPTVEPYFKDTINGEMVIELTSACNLNCIYCYVNGGDNPHFIDWQTAKSAIDYKLSKYSGKFFIMRFAGSGEPLLAFQVMKKCYEYAKKKCDKKRILLNTYVTTNGTLINEDMVKWFKKINMYVMISFDGLQKLQNKQRPFRDGSPTNDSIENTVNLFNKYGIQYHTQTTITQYSLGKMVKIIKNLHRMKIKNYNFGNVIILGRSSKNHLKSFPTKTYEKELEKAKSIAKKYNMNFIGPEENETSIPVNTICAGCGHMFVITACKNITSCLTVTDPIDPAHKIFCYGKIKNGKVIIYKNRLKRLKEMLPIKMKKCNQCFAKYFCFGECPMKTARKRKSSFKPSKQECTIIKAKAKKNLQNMFKIQTIQ
ncbi:MAG: radical SAM protein [Nanoarchaeota archaeon]|nr:radical SAM protein [Nanoarchaeota archaeon]